MFMRFSMIGVTVATLAACGLQSPVEKRSALEEEADLSSAESTAAGDFVFGTDSVSFSLDAPDELAADAEKEVIEPADSLSLPESKRIGIACRDYRQSEPVDGEDKPAPYATLVVSMEEMMGDAIGLETAKLRYNCPNGASISVSGVNPRYKYRFSAKFYKASGDLAYEGRTEFFMPGESPRVRMVMKKVQPPQTQLDIEMVFEDQPNECRDDYVCPEYYQPVTCTATVYLKTGDKIALKERGTNKCFAHARLSKRACELGGKIGEVQCYQDELPPPPRPQPQPDKPNPQPEPRPDPQPQPDKPTPDQPTEAPSDAEG